MYNVYFFITKGEAVVGIVFEDLHVHVTCFLWDVVIIVAFKHEATWMYTCF